MLMNWKNADKLFVSRKNYDRIDFYLLLNHFLKFLNHYPSFYSKICE